MHGDSARPLHASAPTPSAEGGKDLPFVNPARYKPKEAYAGPYYGNNNNNAYAPVSKSMEDMRVSEREGQSGGHVYSDPLPAMRRREEQEKEGNKEGEKEEEEPEEEYNYREIPYAELQFQEKIGKHSLSLSLPLSLSLYLSLSLLFFLSLSLSSLNTPPHSQHTINNKRCGSIRCSI